METGLTRGIGHIISSFSVICREREDRRRSCGGDSMEERGILSRESLAGRNVWTEGVRSWWAGGFAGAWFPRDSLNCLVPQLYVWAELLSPLMCWTPNSGVQARPTNSRYRRGESTLPIYRHRWCCRHREILPVIPRPRGPNVYLVIASLIPRYLDYQRVCASQFSSSIEYFRAYAGCRCVKHIAGEHDILVLSQAKMFPLMQIS